MSHYEQMIKISFYKVYVCLFEQMSTILGLATKMNTVYLLYST